MKNLEIPEDDLIECNCLFCNKNYQQKFDLKLKERFVNTYTFSNQDYNKFILILEKVFIFRNVWMAATGFKPTTT